MLQNPSGNKKGISIIEMLVAVAILGVTLTSIFGLINFSLTAANLTKQTTQANALAQETMEAVRSFRDRTVWNGDGLGTLTVGSAYHQEKTATTPLEWTLLLGQETIDIFTREVVFATAYRDINDNIIDSGTEDPATKKATVAVFWQERGRNHKVELVNYFTNWQE